MKASTLILGTLAAVSVGTVANASTTDHLGKVTAGHSYAFAFASTRPPVSFTDYVVFRLGSAGGDVSESIMNLLNVNGLKVELQDRSGGTGNDYKLASPPASFNFGDLGKGKWRLEITGKTGGSDGSDSMFNGHLLVAAVPEPSTLAMLFAGIGLLGAYQWRRRHKSAAQSISGSLA